MRSHPAHRWPLFRCSPQYAFQNDTASRARIPGRSRMNGSRARLLLRQSLQKAECNFVASVFDPISARIADQLGYRSGILAGSVASLSVLGAPDLILLTLSELVEQARRVCRTMPDFPLIVDADHGYGNALNVRRAVEDLEAAGVAAITIEDTDLPLKSDRAGAPELVPLETGVAKIAAALDARRDEKLVIIARTSVAALPEPANLALRCRAYAEAGADAVFLSGAIGQPGLVEVGKSVNCPIVLSSISPAIADAAQHGVRLVLGGHDPVRQAIAALYDAMLVQARKHGVSDAPDRSSDAGDLLAKLTLAGQYEAWKTRFLR
ncbi:MAG: isocitrate lyase/PEP mutase family protein [Alphaproteobacteria bacterium]|nr:isocitrate lyase/PEP mutase family protein [Alphaproteobacteria bacterium]